MRIYKYIITFLILPLVDFAIISCVENSDKVVRNTSINGKYEFDSLFSYGSLIFYSDSLYAYYGRGCTASTFDSGKFILKYDTIKFYSSLKGRKFSPNSDTYFHDISEYKYLLQNGKIYFAHSKNKFDSSFYYKKITKE